MPSPGTSPQLAAASVCDAFHATQQPPGFIASLLYLPLASAPTSRTSSPANSHAVLPAAGWQQSAVGYRCAGDSSLPQLPPALHSAAVLHAASLCCLRSVCCEELCLLLQQKTDSMAS